MWKKIAIAGSVGAVVLGAGTAALATTGSSPSPTPSTSSSAGSTTHAKGTKDKGKAQDVLRRAVHAEWTTRDGKGSTTYVQHDAIRGAVTAVSPTSITVKAADGTSETFTLSSTTKIHVKGQAKGATGSATDIKTGDNVGVLGTGTGEPYVATAVLDRGTASTASTASTSGTTS